MNYYYYYYYYRYFLSLHYNYSIESDDKGRRMSAHMNKVKVLQKERKAPHTKIACESNLADACMYVCA